MVKIKRNTNGDTMVATHVPTIIEFTEANESHRKDVRSLMEKLGDYICSTGVRHDWSKTNEPYKSMFYRDLCNTIEGKMDFMDGEWAKLHYEEMERHHLLRHVPDDVNLVDVLEMICDCVCAGLARSGDVRPLEIDNEVLTKAMENTVELLKGMCEVVDE